MQRTLSILLLTVAALTGCGGSGSGSSSSSSAAAPVSTAATTTQTQSAPVASSTQSPNGSNGSGGLAGADLRTYDARDYHLLVPQSYDPQTPMPLLVMFHGSGDTADNFNRTLQASGWHAAAEAEGVILVVPDTKSPFQSFPVWSGNPNNDIPEMRTELAGVTELLAQDVLTRFNVDLTSVHALGFSDGGLFNAAVGLSEASFASHSIWGYGWGGFYISQPARQGPVRFRCGTADRFHPNAVQSEAFLAAQGHATDLRELAGVGHTMSGLSTDPDAELRVLKGLALSAVPSGALNSSTPTTPTTPTTGTGSGGTGGQPGLQTRSVQTQAQAGLPSIAIDYDVYVPSTYTAQTPHPIVFAANMGMTPWRALAEQEGVIVVDFRDHDRNGGFNFNYDVLGLNAILTDVEGAFNVDTKRRYYHGFSAGAHWGYVVVLSNANTFAGLGINAGSMGLSIQQGVWPGQVSRKIPIAIRHGVTDQVVPVAAGQQDRARLMNANHPVAYEEFQGGHTVSTADAQAIWNALQAARAP
jgi:poly(3-hydroxybutyrate) depolymerase